MKIAFVNCWIMPGGVLNVFQDMIESQSFDQAKIFTLFSDRKSLVTSYGDIAIITALPSWLNQLFLKFSNKKGLLASILDYRNLMFFYIPLMKILSKKIKKYNSQKIEISSFAVAKNIAFCHKDYFGTYQPQISLYLHSPMQYIWSHYDEYINKITGYKLTLFKRITPKLRERDQQYTRYSTIYANSQHTANLAKEIYNIDAKIKYPKVEEAFLDVKVNLAPNSYYLYVGRLVKFVKELDKIIQLFNEIKQPLLIMGNGPDEQYLKSIATGNIIFIGRIQDPVEKMKIIQNAKGLINITKESFGICTAEALLSGVPVFGYDGGATPELVDSDSGILIPNKEHKTLLKYFSDFAQKEWNRQKIQDNIKSKILPSYDPK